MKFHKSNWNWIELNPIQGWVEIEPNCPSSSELGLGNCECFSHPALKSRKLTHAEAIAWVNSAKLSPQRRENWLSSLNQASITTQLGEQ
jgi:hypothetical protein